MSNDIEPVCETVMLNGLANVEAARDAEGWDENYLFGVMFQPDKKLHGFRNMPESGEAYIHDNLKMYANVVRRPEVAQRIVDSTPGIIAAVAVHEIWMLLPESEEQAKADLLLDVDPADHPRGREAREGFMVDIWGRAYGLIRLRGVNGEPDEVSPIPFDLFGRFEIVHPLAQFVQSLIPRLASIRGDLDAADKLIERLFDKESKQMAERMAYMESSRQHDQ